LAFAHKTIAERNWRVESSRSLYNKVRNRSQPSGLCEANIKFIFDLGIPLHRHKARQSHIEHRGQECQPNGGRASSPLKISNHYQAH